MRDVGYAGNNRSGVTHKTLQTEDGQFERATRPGRQQRRCRSIPEVTEVKTVPYLPISHPFVKRLIGTIRREYLDLVPFWTAHDLENKLLSFKAFYNDQRCHYALDGDTPSERNAKIRTNVAGLDSYRWRSHCKGLYRLPVAA